MRCFSLGVKVNWSKVSFIKNVALRNVAIGLFPLVLPLSPSYLFHESAYLQLTQSYVNGVVTEDVNCKACKCPSHGNLEPKTTTNQCQGSSHSSATC